MNIDLLILRFGIKSLFVANAGKLCWCLTGSLKQPPKQLFNVANFKLKHVAELQGAKELHKQHEQLRFNRSWCVNGSHGSLRMPEIEKYHLLKGNSREKRKEEIEWRLSKRNGREQEGRNGFDSKMINELSNNEKTKIVAWLLDMQLKSRNGTEVLKENRLHVVKIKKASFHDKWTVTKLFSNQANIVNLHAAGSTLYISAMAHLWSIRKYMS